MIDKNYYRGKTILIVGINSTEGTFLTFMLEKLGAKVYGYDNLAKKNSLAEKIELDKHINVCYGEITSPAVCSTLVDFVANIQPSVIFNLTDADEINKEDYFSVFNHNVMGNVILLETLRALDKQISIVNLEKQCYIENMSEAERNIYNCSKNCSRLIFENYNKENNLFVSTIITGETVSLGPSAFMDNVIDLLERCETCSEPVYTDNYEQSYIHVLDLCYSMLLAAEHQVEYNLSNTYYLTGNKMKKRDIINILELPKDKIKFKEKISINNEIGKDFKYTFNFSPKKNVIKYLRELSDYKNIVEEINDYVNEFLGINYL